MKKGKTVLSCLIVCLLFLSLFRVNVQASEVISYDAVLEAYRNGEQMTDWVVEARKKAAAKLGLSEYLDERSFLSIDYRNEYKIGRCENITNPNLNILVEMATAEEEEMILLAGQIQTFAETRAIVPGTTVAVTQKARVSGAGNGYFTVEGSNSYGYCAQNSNDFWNNEQVKTGKIAEWNNADVRKVLYYAPGGPGYSGPYYGSIGADMDHATFAVGKLNGDTANNTKATKYINKVKSLTDPLSLGYKAYKVDIAEPYQDVAFLAKNPNITVTITKVSSDTGTKLTGAKFELWAYTGSKYDKFVGDFTDNGNGTYSITFPFNAATASSGGSYYYMYKEVEAPEGYKIDAWIASGKGFTIDKNLNGTTSFIEENSPIVNTTVQLKKISANPDITDESNVYSLAGAEYKVYSDVGCLNEVGTFITDETGNSNILTLEPGTYYVKEIVAPNGYFLDTEVHEVNLAEGDHKVIEVTEYPSVLQLEPNKFPETGSIGNICCHSLGFLICYISLVKKRRNV